MVKTKELFLWQTWFIISLSIFMLLSFLLIKERVLPENLKIKFITYQKTFDELSKKNGLGFVETNSHFQVADLKPEFLSLPSYSMRK